MHNVIGSRIRRKLLDSHRQRAPCLAANNCRSKRQVPRGGAHPQPILLPGRAVLEEGALLGSPGGARGPDASRIAAEVPGLDGVQGVSSLLRPGGKDSVSGRQGGSAGNGSVCKEVRYVRGLGLPLAFAC